jgi:hypothetical protein
VRFFIFTGGAPSGPEECSPLKPSSNPRYKNLTSPVPRPRIPLTPGLPPAAARGTHTTRCLGLLQDSPVRRPSPVPFSQIPPCRRPGAAHRVTDTHRHTAHRASTSRAAAVRGTDDGPTNQVTDGATEGDRCRDCDSAREALSGATGRGRDRRLGEAPGRRPYCGAAFACLHPRPRLLVQGGNFPDGDGDPRGTPPTGTGTKIDLAQWGCRGGAPVQVRGRDGGYILPRGGPHGPDVAAIQPIINSAKNVFHGPPTILRQATTPKAQRRLRVRSRES